MNREEFNQEFDKRLKQALGCRYCHYAEGHAPKCETQYIKQKPVVLVTNSVPVEEAWLADEEARMF